MRRQTRPSIKHKRNLSPKRNLRLLRNQSRSQDLALSPANRPPAHLEFPPPNPAPLFLTAHSLLNPSANRPRNRRQPSSPRLNQHCPLLLRGQGPCPARAEQEEAPGQEQHNEEVSYRSNINRLPFSLPPATYSLLSFSNSVSGRGAPRGRGSSPAATRNAPPSPSRGRGLPAVPRGATRAIRRPTGPRGKLPVSRRPQNRPIPSAPNEQRQVKKGGGGLASAQVSGRSDSDRDDDDDDDDDEGWF